MNTDTRKIAAEYRLSHWAKIMQERKDSGMSIRQYCETAGFHENIYFYWQRKLRQAACEKLLLEPQNNTASITDKPIIPSGWAQLVESEPATVSEAALTIEISGFKVKVTSDTDTALLTKVCGVLKSL